MSFIAACLGGPLLRQLVASWWSAYKARQANKPIPMRFRDGRWRAPSLIQSVERAIDYFSYFGIVCVLLGVVGAVYGATR